MKRVFAIFGFAMAGIAAALWLTVLVGNRSHFFQIPPSGNHRDYIEVRKRTRFHLLLGSDRRGVVLPLFVRRLPLEKAPGPPGSEETSVGSSPAPGGRLRRMRVFLGFENESNIGTGSS